MPNTVRVDLEKPFEQYHVLVNVDEVTIGLLEDVQSGSIKQTLDALNAAIVGGELPGGTNRAGLRRLKPAEFGAVARAVVEAAKVPNAG